MRHRISLAAIVRMLGLLAGLWLPLLALRCTPEPGTGSARLEVRGQNLATTDVLRVVVDVTGPGVSPPLTVELDEDAEGVWSGTLDGIPAGTDRTFVAEAIGAGDEVLYDGEATGVEIVADQTTAVHIILQQSTPPDPFINSAPRILSVVAVPAVVPLGGLVGVSVEALDPDGDPMTFLWSAAGGSFATPSAEDTEWTAPDDPPGTYSLEVAATDSRGATTTSSIAVVVEGPTAPAGTAEILATLNTWPVIQAMNATPSPLVPGVGTELSVMVFDPDGDSLAYVWSTDCSGTFDDDTSAGPLFVLDQSPSTNECDFLVDIHDGRGGSAEGRLNVPVSSDDRGWSLPIEIGPPFTGATPDELLVAAGGDGHAVAIWLRAAGSTVDGEWGSARFLPSTGDWEPPRVLTSNSEDTQVFTPRTLAVSTSGTAAAGWVRGSAGARRVMAATSDPGNPWGEAVQLSSEGADAVIPAFAPTWAGLSAPQFVGIWYEIPAGLASSIYEQGTWSEPSTLGPRFSGGIGSTQIGLNGESSGLAAWLEGSLISNALYSHGGGWGPVQTGPDPVGAGAALLSLAVAPDTSAMAVWATSNTAGGERKIVAARFVPSSGWSESQVLFELLAYNASETHVAYNGQYAIATWTEDTTPWIAVFDEQSGWSTAESPEHISGSGGLQVEIAPSGVGTLVFADGRIVAQEYRAGAGWSEQTIIADHASSHNFAMDAVGNATVVWLDQQRLWASRKPVAR